MDFFKLLNTLSFALLVSICQGSFAQPEDEDEPNYRDQVQIMYVAYYGRPGDAGGLDYWAAKLEEVNGKLSEIINNFGNSKEFQDRFGRLSVKELVNNLYFQLLGREADSGGLNFYVNGLLEGRFTPASIALNLADGTRNNPRDNAIKANKLRAANAFSQAYVETGATYGEFQIDEAKRWLAEVGSSEDSVTAALVGLPELLEIHFGGMLPTGSSVTIPDANLRALIEAAMGKPSRAPITSVEMQILTGLDARNAGISDLTGLEFATNLTRLDLGSNAITDLTPLEGLTNLTVLYLGNNTITDMSALEGLTNLTELSLYDINISDVSTLEGLTNLTTLGLENNTITDVSPLESLTNLTELSLSDNNISDVTAMGSLTNLTELSLNDNNISGVTALGSLTNLSSLGLGGNTITDVSPLEGLTSLTGLGLHDNNISDVTALGSLTNLSRLSLYENNISDVSPLGGLTNLTALYLYYNNISDVSPLGGLTNLTSLNLGFNMITDVSGLGGLTNLSTLGLDGNNISDISAPGGLTKLAYLNLGFNTITDVSPLGGWSNHLSQPISVNLRGNPLNSTSINNIIPALDTSRFRVTFDLLCKGDFDIELVFLDQFAEGEKRVLQYAALRWMSVITEDLPDYEFTKGVKVSSSERPLYEIPSGERIDDLRIYVYSFERGSFERVDSGFIGGYGGPGQLRENHLPVVGSLAVRPNLARRLLNIGLHEIGHVLGFGTLWDTHGFRGQNPPRDEPNADPHFNGPLAIAAFDDAGGWDYTGEKVPVHSNGGHWRDSVLPGEVMNAVTGSSTLSEITVQSLADLGYGVDVTRADPYTLPGAPTIERPPSRVGTDCLN